MSKRYLTIFNGYASMGAGPVDRVELKESLQNLWSKSLHYFEYGHIKMVPKLELTEEEKLELWSRHYGIDLNTEEGRKKLDEAIEQINRNIQNTNPNNLINAFKNKYKKFRGMNPTGL